MTGAEEVRRAVLAVVDAERARLVEAERRVREGAAQVREQNDDNRREWRAACAAAEDAGEVPPPPPVLQDGMHLQRRLHRLADQRQALGVREQQVLAAAVDHVEAEWSQVLPGLVSRALVVMAEVDAIAAEVGGWRSLLQDTRTAADRQEGLLDGPGARTPAPGRLTVVEVLGAGADPLQPVTVRRADDGPVVLMTGDGRR